MDEGSNTEKNGINLNMIRFFILYRCLHDNGS